MKDRWEKAGTRIMGPWHAALDGCQGDADFIAHLFKLKRTMEWLKKISLFFSNLQYLFIVPKLFDQLGSYRHTHCCFHCEAMQSVQDVEDEGLLYTNFGIDAKYRARLLSWIRVESLKAAHSKASGGHRQVHRIAWRPSLSASTYRLGESEAYDLEGVCGEFVWFPYLPNHRIW